MASITTVNGPSFEGGLGMLGTGYFIGDGFVLTAGHVAYDYDHASDSNPSAISTSNIRNSSSGASVTIALDYKGYRAQYAAEVAQAYLAADATSSPHPSNTTVEARLSLVARDSVLITKSGNVSGSDAGLVVFLDASDMVSLSTVFSGTASVKRLGNTTGTVTGDITAASGGMLTFNQVSIAGDSGGPYMLDLGGKSYVLGTQSATSSTAAYGTYFSKADWDALNGVIGAGHTGDVSGNEPTNMVVATNGADGAILGSYRSDIILARDGADTLNDGDAIGAAVWANDQLFGGADNDTFVAGGGADLLHGGDYRAYSGGGRTTLEADGSDTMDYSGFTAVDSSAGIKITLVDQSKTPLSAGDADVSLGFQSALGGTSDFQAAVFVSDQGRTHSTDTLISIETIIGTDAVDTLQIKHLSGAFLAGTDHNGGLYSVDLKGGSTAALLGDTIDLSSLDEAGKVDLRASATSAFGPGGYVAAVADGSRGLKVANAERVLGSDHDDDITGSDQANELLGGDGNDKLAGDAGDDKLFGDGGHDTLEGGDGDDQLTGGDGNDLLIGGDGEDVLTGGDGDDILMVGAGKAQISGGAGDDWFWFDHGVSKTFDMVTDYTLSAGDAGDSLYWNGYALAGGDFIVLDEMVNETGGTSTLGSYLDANGVVYNYSPYLPDLMIILPTNEVILISGFANGMYGLTFAEAPDMDDWDSLPRSNICGNSTWLDFENLSGRATALGAAGPVPVPTAPQGSPPSLTVFSDMTETSPMASWSFENDRLQSPELARAVALSENLDSRFAAFPSQFPSLDAYSPLGATEHDWILA